VLPRRLEKRAAGKRSILRQQPADAVGDVEQPAAFGVLGEPGELHRRQPEAARQQGGDEPAPASEDVPGERCSGHAGP